MKEWGQSTLLAQFLFQAASKPCLPCSSLRNPLKMEETSHTRTWKPAAIRGKRSRRDEVTKAQQLVERRSSAAWSASFNSLTTKAIPPRWLQEAWPEDDPARRQAARRGSAPLTKAPSPASFRAGGGLGYTARDRALSATTGTPALPAGRVGTGKGNVPESLHTTDDRDHRPARDSGTGRK